jgi:hypothetical protein
MAMSIVEDLERLHTQRPFNPFTIHLSDGAAFYVPFPEFMAHKPGSTRCVVLNMNAGGANNINLANVTRLATEEPAEANTI